MFASLATAIRRLPRWGQALAWPLYGLVRAIAYLVEQFGALITAAAASFFGVMVRGSFMAVLAKIAALCFIAGALVAGMGFEELGANLITLGAPPLMLLGLVYVFRAVFR